MRTLLNLTPKELAKLLESLPDNDEIPDVCISDDGVLLVELTASQLNTIITLLDESGA